MHTTCMLSTRSQPNWVDQPDTVSFEDTPAQESPGASIPTVERGGPDPEMKQKSDWNGTGDILRSHILQSRNVTR